MEDRHVGLAMLSILGGYCRNPERILPNNGAFECKGRYRETTKSDLVAFRKRVERRRAKKGYS